MSVYNRKMFKPRNARNALNMSAGIAPVQKFHAGGPVGHTHGIQTRQVPISGFGANTSLSQPVRNSSVTNAQAINAARSASPLLNARMNVLQGRGTAPLRQTMNSGSATINLDPSSLSGIGSILSRSPQPEQSFREFYGGGLKSMVTNPNPMTVGQQTRSDLAGMAATPVDAVVGGVASGMDAIGNLLSPLTSDELTPGFVAAVVSGKQSLPDSVKQQINNREISVPKALSDALLSGKVDPTGIDLAKLSGFQTSQEVADVVEIMNAAPGSQTIAVEKPVPVGPDGQYDGDDLGNAPTTEPDSGDEFGNIAPDGTMPETTTESTNDTAAATTETTTTDATGDAAPTSKEEIDRVINKGTQEEKQSTLDGFIKEFMDKAPGYEGADSGLVLAKIGFAMAAGKSPRAIENIATAMSDGADMLIKDKAKKDEFNRQLKLSAMQYGFTETGKLRAEDRLEARERRGVKEMVVGAGGTTYKGKTYKPNESIFIDVGDIRDGNMPENITNTATLTALANQAKATNAFLKQQLDAKTISLTEYQKQIGDYRDAVTTAVTSEVGIGLLEGAMVNTAEGKVTGVSPAVKDMLNKGGNFFGMDLGTEYETLDDVRNAMRASLQDLIPVTLGASQSANSISNRDVDFLIEAYFGAGALTGGSLSFATTDPDQMVKRLQRASAKMREAQKGAFATMNTVTNTLTPVFQPGTQQSALGGLSQEQQRLAQAGLGTGGTTTFTSIGATRGDDGVIRLNLS